MTLRDSGAAPALLELSAGDADAAPTFRREVKFALPYLDFGKLRSILDVNCRRVSYDGPSSRVVSVYFDDARLSSCHQNLDGTPLRSKLRLRWYDSPLPTGEVFFEVKRRENEAMSKERFRLRSRVPLDGVDVREIVDEVCRALPARQAEMLRARPEPVLITDYERTYYEAKHAPLRVTVDTDLRFYPQRNLGPLRRRFAARVPELVVLEGKVLVGSEHRLRELFLPLEPRVTRSSKFVTGCQQLGLLPGAHLGPI